MNGIKEEETVTVELICKEAKGLPMFFVIHAATEYEVLSY